MNDLATAIDNMVLTSMVEYVWCWGSCEPQPGAWDYLFGQESHRDDDAPIAPQMSALLEMCLIAMRITDWLRGAAYIIGAIALGVMSLTPTLTGRFPKGNFLALLASMFVLSSVPSILAFVMNGDVGLSCAVIEQEYPLSRLYPDHIILPVED